MNHYNLQAGRLSHAPSARGRCPVGARALVRRAVAPTAAGAVCGNQAAPRGVDRREERQGAVQLVSTSILSFRLVMLSRLYSACCCHCPCMDVHENLARAFNAQPSHALFMTYKQNKQQLRPLSFRAGARVAAAASRGGAGGGCPAAAGRGGAQAGASGEPAGAPLLAHMLLSRVTDAKLRASISSTSCLLHPCKPPPTIAASCNRRCSVIHQNIISNRSIMTASRIRTIIVIVSSLKDLSCPLPAVLPAPPGAVAQREDNLLADRLPAVRQQRRRVAPVSWRLCP